jgi:hypothetical protein
VRVLPNSLAQVVSCRVLHLARRHRLVDVLQPGKFINQKGQFECLDCPLGKHQTLSGQSSCTNCTIG